MFDTSVVRPRAIAAPRFALFGVSVAVHSGAVIAAIALSLASTQLPTRPPGQMEIYRPVTLPEVPPAYGRTPRPANPQPAPRPTPAAQQLPAGTAPNLIPDQTPVVGPDTGPVTPETGTGEGPAGVPWGTPGGVSTDTEPVTPVVAQPVTYSPGGDVRPARVLQRVQPRYPQIMLKTGMAAVVTVHCIIGKDGTIRDPQIVQSSFPPFNEAVLDAVRQWTFAPGTRRGEPVDTYFDLTVRFIVSR